MKLRCNLRWHQIVTSHLVTSPLVTSPRFDLDETNAVHRKRLHRRRRLRACRRLYLQRAALLLGHGREQEVYDLLDAFEYSERIASDFSDVIADL